MIEKIKNYLKGTRAELKHVNWPTRRQTTNFTLLVIGASVAVAILLGVFDVVFSGVLNRFVL